MYRQQQPSIFTPPQTLRRRQHGHSTETVPPGLGFSGQLSPRRQGWNQTLDLSVCHAASPFSNRFAALATPDEPTPIHNPMFPSFPVVPNPNRTRTRASRGTKEAKKRRDLRRNRRKLAAQMLDAQLAQTFDETLTRANIPPPPPARAAYLPAPPSPREELPERLLGISALTLTPPEVPMPEFEPFNMEGFPHLLPTNKAPEVHVATPFSELPAWCPPIRSLTMQDVWRDCLPTFFDLSSLPEPKPSSATASTTGPCRDLQLWKPQMALGRKQSRFFPAKDGPAHRESVFGEPRVKVKLPPIRTKLHSTDSGIRRSPSTLSALMIPTTAHDIHLTHSKPSRKRPFQTREDHSTGPELQVPSYYQEKEALAQPTTIPNPNEEVRDEATAANLWRILQTPPGSEIVGIPVHRGDEYIASHVAFLPDPYDLESAHLLYAIDPHPPQELDSRELPYVHANSLTGYSNETTSTLVGPDYEIRPSLRRNAITADDLPIVRRADCEEEGALIGTTSTHIGPDYESRPSLTTRGDASPTVHDANYEEEGDLIGFNEMLVDHDILATAAYTPLPLTPPRSPVLSAKRCWNQDSADALPIDCGAKHTDETSDGAERDPTAHFRSEQALFQNSSNSDATGPGFFGPSQGRNLTRSSRALSSASTTSSLLDVEEFLKLGHARNCWCGQCDAGEEGKMAELDNDSAVSLCLDVEERQQLPEGEAAVSDAATTASENGERVDDEGDEGDDEDWMFYTPGADEAVLEFYLPSSPALHHELVSGLQPVTACSAQEELERLDEECLERRSSEWELEWDWDPEF